MCIYHRLSTTIREGKAESDGILGCFLGSTVSVVLAGGDPDRIQVQRWDGGILKDGDVEPVPVADSTC